ncbi:hypothetical protein KCP74_14990 [Salmonella enterica subsp. enterica]|nr:hypothetical protein KCP74_14990 [Salmonella enterica subsp. enterica]
MNEARYRHHRIIANIDRYSGYLFCTGKAREERGAEHRESKEGVREEFSRGRRRLVYRFVAGWPELAINRLLIKSCATFHGRA